MRAAAWTALIAMTIAPVVSQTFAPKPAAGGTVKAKYMPFPFMDKTVGFTTKRLMRTNFIEMSSAYATYPKGLAKAPGPVKVAQLEYGYKKNGLVILYESPIVKGVSADSFLKAVMDSHAFKDFNGHQGFKTQVIKNSSLFILLTSASSNAAMVAKAELDASR